jgi:hypothetical protein
VYFTTGVVVMMMMNKQDKKVNTVLIDKRLSPTPVLSVCSFSPGYLPKGHALF